MGLLGREGRKAEEVAVRERGGTKKRAAAAGQIAPCKVALVQAATKRHRRCYPGMLPGGRQKVPANDDSRGASTA